MLKLDYNKISEVLQPLRDKYREAQEEMEKQQHLMDYYDKEMDRVSRLERERQYALPQVSKDEEDETPQPGDDMLGDYIERCADDSRITGSQD